MKKQFSLFAAALAVVLLVGAGCSTDTTSTETGSSDTSEVSADAMMNEGMGLHEIEGALVDSLYSEYTEGGTEGYKNMKITEETGTCSDLGLTEFTYVYDDALKVHMGTIDGVADGLLAGFSAEGNDVQFYSIPVNDDKASCKFVVEGESLTGTCTASGEEVCAGTFSGVVY